MEETKRLLAIVDPASMYSHGPAEVVAAAIAALNAASAEKKRTAALVQALWKSQHPINELIKASDAIAVLKTVEGLPLNGYLRIWGKVKKGTSTQSRKSMTKKEFERACKLAVKAGGRFASSTNTSPSVYVSTTGLVSEVQTEV